MKLKLIMSLACTAFIFSSCFSQSNTNKETTKAAPAVKSGQKKFEVDAEGLSKRSATMKTVHGNIKFKFYPNLAPNTVTRIVELIESGFYNGIIFHRVVPQFVIQAGDPTATGTGGSGKKIKAEFSKTRKHQVGSLSMARSQNPDSADSQFFVCLKNNTRSIGHSCDNLDGKYTLFGQVIKGQEVVERIVQGDKIISFSMDN